MLGPSPCSEVMEKSWSFRLKNGLAQGSVLAPSLCNIYTADFPKTSGNCFMYADDVAITYFTSNIAKVQGNLSTDMKTVCQYLHDCHLKLSRPKTMSSLFHLKNQLTLKLIKVTLDSNTILKCEQYPTYLHIIYPTISHMALVKKLSEYN